jgi:rhodanese-related sulfurtransferase
MAQTKIDNAGLVALLEKDKSVVVIDVRTADEFATEHLPLAKLLPFDAIDAASTARVLPKKSTKVVVYCHSGRRSSIAAQTLKSLGYTNIYDFGAIANWTGKLTAGAL